jgi:hypothetical protein
MGIGKTVLMIEPDELSRLLLEHENRIVERLRPQMQVVEQSISHKEAAAFLNISRNTLTERIKSGMYPASIVHINGTKKEYYRSELKELLNRKR